MHTEELNSGAIGCGGTMANAAGVTIPIGLSRLYRFVTFRRERRHTPNGLNPKPSTVKETDNMRERRANPIGRAATASVPRVTVGGLRLAVLDLEQTANFMIDIVFPRRRVSRPLYLTSANGEVVARCSTESVTERLFRAADLINA